MSDENLDKLIVINIIISIVFALIIKIPSLYGNKALFVILISSIISSFTLFFISSLRVELKKYR